jgi:hypothetical protein
MLISQTFRGSAKLEERGFKLLQKWYMLTNKQKQEIIKKTLADNFNTPDVPSQAIRGQLESEINRVIPDAMINALKY